MAGMKDLLGDTPYSDAYPSGPGWQHGSATSRAAADSVRGKLAPVKAKMIEFLKHRGAHGATYSEFVSECGLSSPTVCGRLVELADDGLIRKSDMTRATVSGRMAVVYLHSSVA